MSRRIITRIMGEFTGFRPGATFVLEHEPDTVYVQVSTNVEDGIYREDPPCILSHDIGRCIAGWQWVLTVEGFGDVVVERVKARHLSLDVWAQD